MTSAYSGDSIQELVKLMEQQLEVLKRIDQRDEASDHSKHPNPSVPLKSNGIWNAITKSTLSDTIHPRIDGLRNGINGILVFLGLFAAIVGGFLLQSLASLKIDQAERTNRLLENLTEIIIFLSARNATDLRFPPVIPFEPDPVDLRLNAYWSLALTLSLAIAALAIACQGFLGRLTLPDTSSPFQRLDALWSRWKSAQILLFPFIDGHPPVIVLPVLLFIAGIIDSLFRVIPSNRIVGIASANLFIVAAVAGLLLYSVIDGVIHRDTSAFQSQWSSIISNAFQGIWTSIPPPSGPTPESLCLLYRELVPTITSDDVLDTASGAMGNFIETNRLKSFEAGLLTEDSRILCEYLLSSEAPPRSNITAAQLIVDIYSEFQGWTTLFQRAMPLVPSLIAAARRSAAGSSLATLWNSPFLRAMSAILQPSKYQNDEQVAEWRKTPAAVALLCSNRWMDDYTDDLEGLVDLAFEICDAQVEATPHLEMTLTRCQLRALLSSLHYTESHVNCGDMAQFLIKTNPFESLADAVKAYIKALRPETSQSIKHTVDAIIWEVVSNARCMVPDKLDIIADLAIKFLLKVVPTWYEFGTSSIVKELDDILVGRAGFSSKSPHAPDLLQLSQDIKPHLESSNIVYADSNFLKHVDAMQGHLQDQASGPSNHATPDIGQVPVGP